MFTEKEIKETNAKTEEKMRQDALFEIQKRSQPGQTFTAQEVASIFVNLAAKTIFLPDGYKLGMKK